MAALDVGLALLLPALILTHLLVAPYTKVEESFTIQAAHDILVYGTPTHDVATRFPATYDHFSFPGAVPRSFVGPVLLSGVSQPLVALFGFGHAQLIVRAVLGLFNAGCILVFARGLQKSLGKAVARWWIVLMAGQFHVVFYASRTLPNMFAFGLTTLASARLLPYPEDARSRTSRLRTAVSILVFAAVIFRSEVALLLFFTVLHLLLTRQVAPRALVGPFAFSFLAALWLSVPLDCYFWQRPLWPELWAFCYNVLGGAASDWGTSPWHYYFTSALPRLLLNPLAPAALIPLACFHPATAPSARALVVPPLLFVAVYSLQSHKEARFVFYVVPSLVAAAAQGAALLSNRRTKSPPLYALATAFVSLSCLASFAAATALLLISSLNYPGGEALSHLYRIVDAEAASSTSHDLPAGASVPVPALAPVAPAVHADVLSCMTGVTLFEQNRAGLPLNLLPDGLDEDGLIASSGTDVKTDILGRTTTAGAHSRLGSGPAAAVLDLDKTEDEAVLRNPVFWSRFDYLLIENPQKVVVDESKTLDDEWEVVAVVEGYAGLEVLRPAAVADGEERKLAGKAAEAVPEDETSTVVVGKGRIVAALRKRVRALTGGWWVGPRMEPRIRIMKRIKDAGRHVGSVASA